MTKFKLMLALFGSGAALSYAPAAVAQAADAGRPATTPESAATASLQAQVEALQAQMDALKKQIAATQYSWKGAPQWADKEDGWSFKPRGRFMYDVAYIDNPGLSIGELPSKDLGFNSRVRRARLGVEGTMPGGFEYKAEADFANNSVSVADFFLEYKPGNSPVSARVGHFETFQSLEQMTSSRHIMFLERAQMNDAFGHAKRLGAAVGYSQGDVLVRAGIFNDTVNSDLDNDEWLFGARAVYAPKWGDNQLHFGANYQHRRFPSQEQSFRYRARPFVTTTGTRFVDTGSFAGKSDNVFGLEAAGIFGPLHVAAEAQWLKANAYAPNYMFDTADAGASNRLTEDPDFTSFYVEAGYWLTGETRGYKKGEWDRTKVRNGFDKGGFGALAFTVRYDRLDLADGALYGGGIGTSRARGGKQTGYLASLVWQPIDYVRVTAQYARADVEGGPFASAVEAGSSEPIDERGYGVDSLAMRLAYDF